jgi:hypothetical protein
MQTFMYCAYIFYDVQIIRDIITDHFYFIIDYFAVNCSAFFCFFIYLF